MANPVMQEAGRKAWQTRRRNQRAAARANGEPAVPRQRRALAVSKPAEQAPRPQPTEGIIEGLLVLESRIEEMIVTLTGSLKLIKDIKRQGVKDIKRQDVAT